MNITSSKTVSNLTALPMDGRLRAGRFSNGEYLTYFAVSDPGEKTLYPSEYALYLSLFSSSGQIGTPKLALYRVTEMWDADQLTYGTRPAHDPIPLVTGTEIFDFSRLAAAWQAGQLPNCGLLLAPASDCPENAYVEFGSEKNEEDYGYGMYPHRSTVTVSESSPSDFDNTYHATETYDLGRAGTLTVDLMLGTLNYRIADAACRGGKLPLGIAHILSQPSRGEEGFFGTGFRLLPSGKIEVNDTGDVILPVHAVYTDGNGYAHPLVGYHDHTDSSRIVLYDTEGLNLMYVEDASSRYLVDAMGNQIRFDEFGRMTEGVDTGGNAVRTVWDGTFFRPLSITDSAGRTANFAYAEDGRLATITDPQGRVTTYSYEESGELSAIGYADGRTVLYTYENGHLASINDGRGVVYRITYDANGRVLRIEKHMNISSVGAEGVVSCVEELKARDIFTYSEGLTRIARRSGLWHTVRMDEKGREVLRYEERGGSSNVSVDENSFTLCRYGSYTLPNGSDRPFVSLTASGVMSTYDNGTSTAKADLMANAGRFTSATSGSLTPAGFTSLGMVQGVDGVMATPINSDNGYRIIGTPTEEKTLSYEKTITPASDPYDGYAFVCRVAVEPGSLHPVVGQEILQAELVMTDSTGAVLSADTVPVFHEGTQTVVACVKIPAGTTPAKLTATVRSKNTSTCIYLDDLRLLSVPTTSVSYVLPAFENITVPHGGSVPVLYRKTTDDGKYVTEEWYTPAEKCVQTKVTDLSGCIFTSYAVYDDRNLLIRSQNYRNIVTEYTYSEKGQVTQEKKYPLSDPTLFYITEKRYDMQGLLQKISDPRGTVNGKTAETVYGYDDDNGNKIYEVAPGGLCTNYGYDYATGHMTSVHAMNGTDHLFCGYSYTDDLLTGISLFGLNYGFAYDGMGRKLSNSVAGNQIAECVYDDTPSAPKVTVEYANGASMQSTKNAKGKDASLTYTPANGTAETLLTATYDGMGRPKKRVDNPYEEEYNYKYGKKGTLTEIRGSSAVHEKYTYDSYGRLLTRTNNWTGTAESFAYEQDADERTYPDARINTMTVTAGAFKYLRETLTRDNLGRLTESNLQDLNSLMYVKRTYTYVSGPDRKTDIVNTVRFQSNNGYNVQFVCAYNANGDITRDGSTKYGLNDYTYDALDRLTSATYAETGVTYTYTYDSRGNILLKQSVDSEGNVTEAEYGYAADGWLDQLMSYNGEACVYDACGNPTTYRGKSVTWSRGRKMTRYGSNIFEYTGEGYRYRKNNTYYSVWQGKILREWTGSNTTYYIYDIRGEVVGMCYNSTKYYYVKNVQGDVVALLDANGRLLGRYIYDPWGKIVKTVDASGNVISPAASTNILNINPIRYRSYYYDRETGFYYLQTRYYDPETGRFLNADSFKYLGADGPIHGMNLYAYCGNNPVVYADPMGHAIVSVLVLAALAVGALFLTSCSDDSEQSEVVDSKTPLGERPLEATPEYKKAKRAVEETSVEFVKREPNSRWNDTSETYYTVIAQIDLTNSQNQLTDAELAIYAKLLYEKCLLEAERNHTAMDSEVRLMSPEHIVWEYSFHNDWRWAYPGANEADLNCEETFWTLLERLWR